MVENKPAPQQTASRNVVIGVVILLIVVAIAGIVLAGRRTAAPAPGTAAALPPTVVASATPVAEEPLTAGANEVLFPAGTDRLPPESAETIATFAENARKVGGMVRLTARFAAGADKAKEVELAKNRTAAVRHAVLSNGVKVESMQVEVVEMPAGMLTPRNANRVELSLR